MNAPAFAIDGELTIYRAGELLGPMLEAIKVGTGRDSAVLALAGVSEIDTAGVQLLLVAQHAARASGRELVLQAPSAAVRAALHLLGLDSAFPVAGAQP